MKQGIQKSIEFFIGRQANEFMENKHIDKGKYKKNAPTAMVSSKGIKRFKELY